MGDSWWSGSWEVVALKRLKEMWTDWTRISLPSSSPTARSAEHVKTHLTSCALLKLAVSYGLDGARLLGRR